MEYILGFLDKETQKYVKGYIQELYEQIYKQDNFDGYNAN